MRGRDTSYFTWEVVYFEEEQGAMPLFHRMCTFLDADQRCGGAGGSNQSFNHDRSNRGLMLMEEIVILSAVCY